MARDSARRSTAAQPPCAQWALLVLLALSSPAAAQMTTGAPPPDADSAERANAPPGTIPPKKASIILVHTADTPDAAYRAVARLLIARGYGLQSSDATLRAMTTTFREARIPASVQLSVIVLEDSLGTVLQLTGVWRWPRFFGDAPTPIEYGGAASSVLRQTWNALYAVAAAYPGGQVEYRVQPK